MAVVLCDGEGAYENRRIDSGLLGRPRRSHSSLFMLRSQMSRIRNYLVPLAVKKLGICASATSDVILKIFASLPPKCSVKWEKPSNMRCETQNGRLSIAAQSLGLAKGSFEMAGNYAKKDSNLENRLPAFKQSKTKLLK